MINDLDTNAQQWKYVDDTTVSEVVVKGGESHAQAIANRVIEWSRENRVQLNADKCKELRISFAKEQRVFDPVIIEGKEVELVTSQARRLVFAWVGFFRLKRTFNVNSVTQN